MGERNRWDGTYTLQTNDNKELVKTLVRNADWTKAIQNTGKQPTLYSLEDYTVQHPKFETFSICPTVYTTTDDCDCCS